MSQIQSNGHMEYRLVNIPENTWHEFKIICLEQKTSIRKKLLEYVEKEVAKKHGKR